MDLEFRDCVIFAINTLLGYPYFRCREQVVRLMKRRGYSTEARALQNKANAGVRMTIFEDTFALYQREDGTWDNFRLHLRWEIKEKLSGEISCKEDAIKRDRLIELISKGVIYKEAKNIRRFILTGTKLDGYSHAFAIVVTDDPKGSIVRVYDSGAKYVQKSKGSTDHYFNIKDFLVRNQVVRLYELQCHNKPAPENYEQIKGVMTGQMHSVHDINSKRNERKAEGILTKQRRKKGKSFKLEPPRKKKKLQ